ncbi:MAG: LacI family DNA-binding transcriptional regulator [Thermotogaceae bacterium]|nr:LacI family DNA-binding transcriptional regulator [Thermotogaceae bacterium]
MKPSLKMIAQALGVHPSTVSRALSGKPGVSEELRSRIIKLAQEMGYFPDSRARSLRQGQTKIIGIVIPDMGNPFFSYAFSAMERVLFPLGYSFFLCVTEENNEKERVLLEKLISYKVDGILAAPVDRVKNTKLYREVQKRGIPVVFFDRRLVTLDTPYVVIDNRGAVTTLIDYLWKKGHRTLGVVTLHKESYTGMERFEAAMKRAKELGMEIKDEWVKDGMSTEMGAYRATLDLFKNDELPSALFVCNNVMALGVLKALKELKVKIPKDISLVTFDDSFWNQIFEPPITCVAQDPEQLGMIAATMMLDRIRYPEKKLSGVILKTHFIERESVRDLSGKC